MLIQAVLACLLATVSAQPTPYGRRFVFAVPPEGYSGANDGSPRENCFLYINARDAATVDIFYLDTQFPQVSVPANDFERVDLPCQLLQVNNNDGTNDQEGKGISVIADASGGEISCFISVHNGAFLPEGDSMLIYPEITGNQEYYLFTPPSDITKDAAGRCGENTVDNPNRYPASFYTFVASEDATTMTIFNEFGEVKSLTLDRLDTYTQTALVEDRQTNFTGWRITSDKGGWVMSGNLCADFPEERTANQGQSFAAMPPVAYWTSGEFFTYEVQGFAVGGLPLPQPNPYRVYVTASQDDTLVQSGTTNVINRTIDAGETTSFSVLGGTTSVVCDKACMVLQQCTNDDENANSIFLTQVTPEEYFGNYALFTDTTAVFQSYVRIVSVGSRQAVNAFRFTNLNPVLDADGVEEDWRCDNATSGSYCTILKAVDASGSLSVVEVFPPNNPTANFSTLTYWAGGNGFGWGFNAGFVQVSTLLEEDEEYN